MRGEAGELSTLSRDIYESSHGPVLNWPGLLDWDENQAYALRDANPSVPLQGYSPLVSRGGGRWVCVPVLPFSACRGVSR